MKNTLFFIYLFFFTQVFAQTSPISLSVSGSFTDMVGKTRENRRYYGKPGGVSGLNYAFGPTVDFSMIDNRLQFSLVVHYSKLTYRTQSYFAPVQFPLVDLDMKYLQPSFSIGWDYLKNEKWGLSTPIGISPMFLLSSHLTGENQITLNNDYVQKLPLGFSLGCLLKYNFNKHLFMNVNPKISYFNNGFDTYERYSALFYQLFLGIGHQF
ncbi:MAG: hypothetical protein ACWA41_11050 [Putridiphycobacter sp.]